MSEYRLVDADKLADEMDTLLEEARKALGDITETEDAPKVDAWLTLIYDAITNAEEIDAVEVTRCNECRFGYPRFWASYGEYRCQRFRNDIFKGDHFCAWGEPRPEDIEP